MKNLKIILKHQYKILAFLLLITVIPLILIYQFLPEEFDKSYYFFLTLLIGLRFSFFKGTLYLEKVKKTVRDDLNREMGRVPSTNDIVKRVDEIIATRDYVFGLCGVLVILVSALYGNL
jgi:hypothetical protein